MTDGLPKHWKWTTCGALASDEPNAIMDGPFGSKLKTEHYTDDGARVIRLGNIQPMRFVDEDRVFISMKYFKTLRTHEVRPGDLLVAALGDPLGRSCKVPQNIGPAIVKADCLRYRPAAAALPDYLVYWLNSPQGQSNIAALSHGIGRKRINTKDLRKIPVPLPPLCEQESITAKLDKCLELSNLARAELDRIPRLVERYREAVLACGLRGELTREWRAAHAVESCVASRETEEPKKRRREGPMPSARLDELPKTWKSATVDSVGDVILGRQRSPENHTGPYMRPYVRAANITWDGWDLSDVKEMNFDETDFKKFRLQRGDVLINEANAQKCSCPHE